MGFNCGILGLPNIGKSTLFNALTSTQQAESKNYPFCTIEPNIGKVAVKDKRLEKLRWDIQGCIDSYCDDAGLEPSLLSTSWFNVMGEGSNVERHRHEGSVVSGAYYPLVEDESCPLIFESPLRQVRMCDVFDKQNAINI